MLAGDFNQLSTKSILERTGLSLVSQPTRGTSILDQILVSQPEYQKVQVLTSVVRSNHKGIVAYADPTKSAATKTTTQRTFCTKHRPNMHCFWNMCLLNCLTIPIHQLMFKKSLICSVIKYWTFSITIIR